MLKGLRWPFVVLVLASGLLVLAWITRPEAAPSAESRAATVTPSPTLPLTPDVAPTSTIIQVSPTPAAVPSTPTPENILVEALVGQIHKLNPLLATYNPVDRDITSLIFEGLTTTDDYGEIIPDLAKSWTVSPDGLEYIFVLRENVLWQDGVPFTADDVVFTVNTMGDPLFPGAASLHDFWRTIEVDALSEHLVRFRLTQPLASFPDQLRIGIIPAHVLKGMPIDGLGRHPFNLAPIGTGPYQIETLTASGGQIDGIQLRVAPVYRQRPEGADGYLLDRIVFRTYPTSEAALDAYRRGEVNSISLIPPELQAAAQQIPGLSLYTAVEPHVGVLIYNWQRDSVQFVRNPRVRLALAHAIDRAALVAKYLTGRAILANSPLLPGAWAYLPDVTWPAYDLAQARAQLETANLKSEEPTPGPTESAPGEGGAETGGENQEQGTPASTAETATPSGEETPSAEATGEPEATPSPPRLALTILTRDDPALVALANDVASGWEQLGFTMSVDPVDAATLQTRLEKGDFDAALVELSFEPNADPDPYVFWHQGQAGSGQNYGGMDDRRISETLEQARRDSNGLNRVALYRRFQELFAERVPALVLYYPLYTYAADARLQGVQLGFLSSPSDRFRHLKDWRFGS
jgi:peptide/nickel transport system substrate-binding protein